MSRSAPRDASRVPSFDLLLLREGRITLEEYLERRIERTLETVSAALRPGSRDAVRAILREELLREPELAELVEKATGRRPGDVDE